MEKILYRLAIVWVVVGLVGGVFYREVTKYYGFEGETQLSGIHVHALVFGFIFSLVVLTVERSFQLAQSRLFKPFIWTWTIGAALTTVMFGWHGMLQVTGSPLAGSAMIAGIAGIGHLVLTVGFVLFLLALRQRLNAGANQAQQ